MAAAQGRAVAVTGAAAGIGRAIAEHFARRGDRVALLDVARERLEDTAHSLQEFGCEVVPVVVDVADVASVTAGFDRAVAAFGGLDVCISNVGVASSTPVLDMSDNEWRRVLGVNLDGTFYVLRAAARHMVQRGQGGRICCVTSLAARSARVGAAPYCASKAGLEMLVRVLCMELAEHRINVNMVSPGFVDHGYREGMGQFVTPEYAEAIARTIPWGRTSTPQDVVPAVDFLCSDDAEYITGALLTVDGGGSAGRFSLPRNNG
jgi:NAD(P)-dependent dehydrogenase (short-subunit alcohol dehydrogenase family)